MTTVTPLIQIRNLVKTFPIGGRQFKALDDINLTFDRGEFSGIIGPSGSGKTTLLNIIGSLDTATNGSALVKDKDVNQLTPGEASRLRLQYMGFIFQSYNLLPVYNVFENVELPLILQKRKQADRKQAVVDALEWVGLLDRAKSRPAQLSGGECQRVAIARAMVKRPDIVLADEPTANLDAKNSHKILKVMAKLNRELGTTFIFSTHDEKVISYLQRRITLEDGRVIEDIQTTPVED